jgi:tetratricopeptide (TPR) repeat protein
MTRFAPLFVAALLTLPACDKKPKEDTNPPDTGDVAAEGGDDADGGPKIILPDVPQDPEPPEIQQAAHQYMLGQYQQAADILSPIYPDLKTRGQYRASGLAGGWLALSLAQGVVEDAEEPSQHALQMADATQDAEVVALAKLAHGAVLMGHEDFDAAVSAFERAARAAPDTLPGALANLMTGEALIGRAFGSGASEQVENPAHLETAKKAYAAARKFAEAGNETNIILGRVEEGLAAVARYQRDKDEICAHSTKSITYLRKAGASEFLIEGPMKLAADFKCGIPKGS